MATLDENLTTLSNTKSAFKTKFSNKNVSTTSVPFTNYPNLLDQMEKTLPTEVKNITPTTSLQMVTATSGYRLAQVNVNGVTSAIDSNIQASNIKQGVTILGVTGTLQVASAQLNAPTISLSGLTLTITNPSTNGNFVTSYDIYSGNTVVANTSNTTYDMSNAVGLTSGSNTITVKAKANGFLDSSASNSETLSVYLVTNTLSNITTSNSASSVLANGSYSATLTPATDWTYGTTTVTMGGNDITSTAYDNGIITIASVTGDIAITSTAYVPITNTLTGVTNSNSAVSVAYGSSYSGTITVDSGYTMEGATISITMGGVDVTSSVYSNGTITIASVTGALVITISAVAVGPVFDRTFGNNSPAQISVISDIISSENMSESDIYTNYGWSVGDTINITLTTNETIQMRILGFNHDWLYGSNYEIKVGITLEMVNCLNTKYRMSSVSTWWKSTEMYTTTLPSILLTFPNDWQTAIKEVTKDAYQSSTVSNKLFLLSEKEVTGNAGSSQYQWEGTQYSYYVAHNTANDRIKYVGSTASSWWTRSISSQSGRYEGFNVNGNATQLYASNNNINGVCLAFCV